jgi:NADH-quinone oxidoreductase subunit D
MVRGSGLAWDLRRSQPYEIYNELDFKIPVGTSGDNYDRYVCRMEEMYESTKIILQCIEKLEPGPVLLAGSKISPPNYTQKAFMFRKARLTCQSKLLRASLVSI